MTKDIYSVLILKTCSPSTCALGGGCLMLSACSCDIQPDTYAQHCIQAQLSMHMWKRAQITLQQARLNKVEGLQFCQTDTLKPQACSPRRRHDRHLASDNRLLGPLADCQHPLPLHHALCQKAACIWAMSHANTGGSCIFILLAPYELLRSQYLATLLADALIFAVCRHRTLAGQAVKFLVHMNSSCYCHSVPMMLHSRWDLVSMP